MSFFGALGGYGKQLAGGKPEQSWGDVGRQAAAQKFGTPLKRRTGRTLANYGTATPAPSNTFGVDTQIAKKPVRPGEGDDDTNGY